eukprot:6484567-Amphidinium_carterae.3
MEPLKCARQFNPQHKINTDTRRTTIGVSMNNEQREPETKQNAKRFTNALFCTTNAPRDVNLCLLLRACTACSRKMLRASPQWKT